MNTTTPTTTININDGAAVIQITPWAANSATGYTPRVPILVVQTCAGELEISYSPTRNRFYVVGRKLRFSGMPEGVTLYAHRDEASYTGTDIARLEDRKRVPQWTVCGSDVRSDKREATRTMVQKCQTHLEFVTNSCGKAGLFARLVEVTTQWDARRRATVLAAEIEALTEEYRALYAVIAADNSPLDA